VLAVQPVGQHVVHERTFRRGQRGVLRLAVGQLRRVVRGDLLDGGKGVLASNLDLPHVADVEHAGSRPDGQVLVGDAAVFDRHIPAAERNHPGTERTVAGMERSLLEGAGGRLRHRVGENVSRAPPAAAVAGR
jgi:hypothetical protein